MNHFLQARLASDWEDLWSPLSALQLFADPDHGSLMWENLNGLLFSKSSFFLSLFCIGHHKFMLTTYHYAVTNHKIGSIPAWLQFVEVCPKVDALIWGQEWEHPSCPMVGLDRRVVSGDKEAGDEGEEEGEEVSKQHPSLLLCLCSPCALQSGHLKNNALICDIIVRADLVPDFHPVTIDYVRLILTPWLRTRKCLLRHLIALRCNDNLRPYIRSWVGRGRVG